jgi:hypothetical protein
VEAVIRDIVSKLVHYASWLSVILTSLATAWWVTIVADGNSVWAALGFTALIPMQLGGGTFLLGVVPSSILYLRNKQRRDRLSLLLAGGSVVTVLVETGLLWIIPMRGE